MAWVVEQRVGWTSGAGGTKSEAIVSWFVNEREFRVDVKRGTDVKSVVFNGRVLYVCGRLDQAQVSFLKSLKIEDQALVASLTKGACQEGGVDFAARFFLSPFDAAANAGSSGGYGTSLQIAEPEIALTGTVDQAAGTKCVNFTRSISMSDKSGAAVVVTETACNAPTIKWRQAMARELGMTMIRMPGGKQNFQAINADIKKMAGLTLATSGQVKGKTASGAAVSRAFEAKTTLAKDRAPTPAELALPYEIIDPKNLAAVAAKATVKAPSGADNGSVVADVLKSLLLGANPAGGAFSAVMGAGSGANGGASATKSPEKKK
jgi:hypothetical protein